jgi:hypothetical protein
MGAPEHIRSYAEFWPYYLQQHSKRATRTWHILGTALAIALLAAALATLDDRLILAAIVAGYGPAWTAHALVEKNRPATFRYPIWSLISDFRMAAAWLSGGLDHDLERAGIQAPPPRRG